MKSWITGGIFLALFMFNGLAAADEIVGAGKMVTLDYTLIVDNKELESSVGKSPLTYVVGGHEIIPGLESQLNGMHINEEKTVKVAAKDAYGEINPKAFMDFPKSSFPKGVEPKVGMSFMASTPDGSQRQVVVSDVKADKVTLNFNHPLAGKELTFKVKILKIEKAPAVQEQSPALKG